MLVYLAALVALFISAFWTVDPFTGDLVRHWNLDNFRTLWNSPAYRNIALRTVGIAAAVTIADAVLAFPLAYFMARIASPRSRAFLFVLVLLPLWSSYLVRVYAWRLILSQDGVLNWVLHGLGLGSVGLAYTNTAVWLVFTYVWLPFMVLPVYASLERIPDSYLEASADLGARGAATARRIDPAARAARASSPARSSPSRSRSATTSRRRSSAARARSSSATSSTTRSASPRTSRSRPRSRSCRSRSWASTSSSRASSAHSRRL